MAEQFLQETGEAQTPVRLDEVDRKILSLLQQDASLSLDQIAERVGASKTPVWNRIRKLREAGVIRRQVAILNPEALGLEACFFVLIRTAEHDRDWAQRFLKALRERPEVVEAHRLAGDIDYILKVQVRNARAYDRFYQSLISEVRIYNVTALLSMEEIKATSALPIAEAAR
ncbi:Lrp/AsnC family transcriptional regulator [Paracoccus stylophorae]|uniref:Lrp/AsnC family transcriptional regulator n=1 Tax=Paracoccus stylophorae TaxID=659350 RepID=A0ABY7SSR6_9RHOB|nr:Lrp/AsnC family transcriptional regulator [Paracoccus stylophorae]WCR10064.1 Lrp/AsnC family transcriptional regulator [Paracoccus stylophorae]